MLDHLGSQSGRIAVLLMTVGLFLVVGGAVYIFVLQSSGAPATLSNDSEYQAIAANRVRALVSVLLISALLILIFVIGSYILIRVGQAVTHRTVRNKPTQYVDAWSQARVSPEEIAAATEEPKPDGTTGAADLPEPPPEDSR